MSFHWDAENRTAALVNEKEYPRINFYEPLSHIVVEFDDDDFVFIETFTATDEFVTWLTPTEAARFVVELILQIEELELSLYPRTLHPSHYQSILSLST